MENDILERAGLGLKWPNFFIWFQKLLLILKLKIIRNECLASALLPFARQKTIYLKNYWYSKQNKNIVVGRNCFFMCPSSMQRCQSKKAVRDVLFFYPMHHVVATRPLLFCFAINSIVGWFKRIFKSQKTSRERPLTPCHQVRCRLQMPNLCRWKGTVVQCIEACHTWFLWFDSSFIYCLLVGLR